MNPFIAIAATLFPEIIKAIAGDSGGRVAEAVSKTVRTAVGTDDASEAEKRVSQDPEIAARLRTELARIALEETRVRLEADQKQRDAALDELKTRAQAEQKKREDEISARRVDFEETTGARIQQQGLISANSPIAWVPAALSVVITIGFFGILVLFVSLKQYLEAGPVPVFPAGLDIATLREDQIRAFGANRSDFVLQIINICVGAIAAAFATVVSFWLGSSQGSRNKDELVSKLQTAQSDQATKMMDDATSFVREKDESRSPRTPSRPTTPDGEPGPTTPTKPDGEPAPTTPTKPAPLGLLAEVMPELVKSHRHFPTGVQWALTARGLSIDTAPPKGTPGEPSTVRKILSRYGDLCAGSAKRYGVPVELIVATIATESSGDPNARRSEPTIKDESVGLMQTLVQTARQATGRKSLRGDDLLDPATSIDAGTAYIAQQRSVTHFDPPLVAAAYNAGSIRRDDSQANRWKLHCFPRGTGQHIDRFAAWFSDCMVVLSSEGALKEANVPSFAALLRSNKTIDRSGPNFPPRPSFPALINTEDRQAHFGAFKFQAAPQPNNPEHIEIEGNWIKQHIVTVSIPVRRVLGKPGPFEMEFHKAAADQLKELWLEWEKEGLLDRIITFDGSFVPRFIRGSSKTLSNHAFGTAFDINAEFNRLKAQPALVGQRGSVRELVPIANKWGFYWGGHFAGRLDGMHFEVARLLGNA